MSKISEKAGKYFDDETPLAEVIYQPLYHRIKLSKKVFRYKFFAEFDKLGDYNESNMDLKAQLPMPQQFLITSIEIKKYWLCDPLKLLHSHVELIVGCKRCLILPLVRALRRFDIVPIHIPANKCFYINVTFDASPPEIDLTAYINGYLYRPVV